jgi:thiosulfate/3-mercaptopyruvate sulfurtransferase
MSALGIDRDTLVVSYSGANHWWASRMWWMLRVFGHQRAAVLDGGLQKWSKEGRPLESGPARAVSAKVFEAKPARQDMIAAKADVLAAIGDDGICTINALRPEQHAGTGGVYYHRRGHIKGSINLAAVQTVDANNVYKDAAALRRQFAPALSKPAVIAYCGGGIAATADALVLAMLGYDNVKVYDASLSEWASDAALPMET